MENDTKLYESLEPQVLETLKNHGITTDEELAAWISKIPEKVLSTLGLTPELTEKLKSLESFQKSMDTENRHVFGLKTDKTSISKDDQSTSGHNNEHDVNPPKEYNPEAGNLEDDRNKTS